MVLTMHSKSITHGVVLLFVVLSSKLFSLPLGASTTANEENDVERGDGEEWMVSWNAPFLSSASGYGSEATSFLKALGTMLNEKKWTIGAGLAHGDIIDQEHLANLPPDLLRLFQKTHAAQQQQLMMLETATVTSTGNENTIFICHSEPGAWSVPTPSYDSGMPCPPHPPHDSNIIVVGRTMFETDRLPKGWEDRLNQVDEIWVPTHHHKNIFVEGGVTKPIVVVGQGIDVEFWNRELVESFDDNQLEHLLSDESSSNLKQSFKCSKEDYRFLSVFKWEARKGPDILLQSFFKAFPRGDEDVCLIIVTSLYHQEEQRVLEEIHSYWSSSSSSSNEDPHGIVLLSGLSTTTLRKLYDSVDAFVLPSRGEGWGRPYMEAMAMGLPVIATNWSGPTEFIDETNGYLLPIQGLVDANLAAFPNHKWANPDSNELVRLFRHLKENPEEAIEKGELARESIFENWSNLAVAGQVAKHLERLSTVDTLSSRISGDKSMSKDEKSEL